MLRTPFNDLSNSWATRSKQLALHCGLGTWIPITLSLNKHGFGLWGVQNNSPLTFERLSAKIHPADRDRFRAAFTATRAVVGSYEIDFRILIGSDARWISARGEGSDSWIKGRRMAGIFLDVTGSTQAEESHELLAGEMSRRVKNLLSIASGLTHITSRPSISIEDIFADFEHMSAPRLAAFDGLDRVIHMGSFSKTLSASARCGFVAAKSEWIEGLTDLKIATSFSSGRTTAEVVYNVLSDGSYRKHMEITRQRLSRAMIDVSASLKRLGIMPWLEPQAGMFLWCRLPGEADAAIVARAALDREIVLAPRNAFSLSQSATHFMRFNISQSLDPRIFNALREILTRQI